MSKTTIAQASLLSLEALQQPSNHWTILKHIQENNFFDFTSAKTPESSISAQLGDLVRAGDSRIGRIRQPNGTYLYYLTKWGDFSSTAEGEQSIEDAKAKPSSYHERDLHILLSSYLNGIGVIAKTIYHEVSAGNDDNKKWIHPDMVGVQFSKMKSGATTSVMRAVNREDLLRLSSYEIKREIKNDSDLKKAFFQALSNSSWANFGYLVALAFDQNILGEMERLHQSFGIGVIELNANPFLSKVLHPAQHRNLDFRTIDKLCHVNRDFEQFMEHTGRWINADVTYQKALEKELTAFCDRYFTTETEAEEYSQQKHISMKANN